MIDPETGSTFGDKTSGDYTPMVPANPIDKGDDSPLDIHDAAAQVADRRASGEAARQQEENEREVSPVDTVRQYNHRDGPRAGQRMPDRETVSAEQASVDLTAARNAE